MEIKLYNKISVEIKDYYQEITKQEMENRYGRELDYAYSIPDKECYIGFKKTNTDLKKADVEKRTVEYYQVYNRMVPGFQKGEVQIKREEKFNMGVMSYKSNGLKSDIFNMLAVMNVEDEELIILMNCNMNTSVAKVVEFTEILNSLRYI